MLAHGKEQLITSIYRQQLITSIYRQLAQNWPPREAGTVNGEPGRSMKIMDASGQRDEAGDDHWPPDAPAFPFHTVKKC